MSQRLRRLASIGAIGLVSTLAVGDAPGVEALDADDTELVYYDGLDERGRLTGGRVRLPRPDLDNLAFAPPAPAVMLAEGGPPANRIDLVTVGDGYRAPELALYAVHVDNAMNVLFAQEPFRTYRNFFNVHRVDVVSNESGVDNDPVQGIQRDTALDMGFWCNGIERLLCVNVPKAYAHANNAPEVDHVLAVANSTKYGGAGYFSSDLATFSGGNGSSPEVAIHEMGHSLGNLADEYHYGDGARYDGPEPPAANVSIYEAAEMAQRGTKWADWLGNPGIGFDGLVDTYEGAQYHQYDIYRPTVNSKMRSLNRPFNLPSVESFIIEMYRLVDPIDDATPNEEPLDGTETVFVDPVDPVGHALDVQWFLAGEAIPGATGTTIDLPSLDLPAGEYALDVEVVDNVEWVIDEQARAALLTERASWVVIVTSRPGDANGDGIVDFNDILVVIDGWGACPEPPDPCPGDLDGNGTVDFNDLVIVLANWDS